MKLKNITVEQFMRFQLIVDTYKEDENKLNTELIKYLYDGNLDIPKKEADKTLKDVLVILNDKPDFIQRFEFDGVEYGFLPKLDDISVGEYIDLDEYIKDGKQLHKIAAILYRPVIKSNGKLYDIEKYEGTSKYANTMMKVDYKVVLGAMVFFWQLGTSLLNHTAIYTQKVIKEMKAKTNKD
jgi:hypothetical protein